MKKKVVDAVFARSRGLCERCSRQAHHLHHRCTRARGGPDHPDNLAHLCSPCHQAVHARNERPWLADGRFIRGVYTGTDPVLTAQFGEAGAA